VSIKGYIQHDNILIERQKYSNVGSEPFFLIPYREPCLFLEKDFAIYTSATGNEQLYHVTHYKWSSLDNLYSKDSFEGEEVRSSLYIVAPQFQNCDLYITYRWVADYLSAEMMNRFDRALDQMTDSVLTTVEGNIVVDNNGNLVTQGSFWPGFRNNLIDNQVYENDDIPILPIRSSN